MDSQLDIGFEEVIPVEGMGRQLKHYGVEVSPARGMDGPLVPRGRESKFRLGHELAAETLGSKRVPLGHGRTARH